ncbi:MAG TPA: DUF4286 family protein [Solirubrobacteraceae bacterium]|jgi:hypothetical protein
MSAERQLLVITVDIDPSQDREFNRWYDEVHVPEITACEGIHAAWRLRSDEPEQQPRYLTCYLVDGPHVLETPELLEVRGWGPFEASVNNYRRLWFRPVGGKDVQLLADLGVAHEGGVAGQAAPEEANDDR